MKKRAVLVVDHPFGDDFEVVVRKKQKKREALGVPLNPRRARVRDERYAFKFWFTDGKSIYGAIRRPDLDWSGWVLCTWRLDGGYCRVKSRVHDWDLVLR